MQQNKPRESIDAETQALVSGDFVSIITETEAGTPRETNRDLEQSLTHPPVLVREWRC